MKRVYDFSLIDWISAALNIESLNAVLGMVKEEKVLDDFIKPKSENRRYIEKILKEEIHNQFCDYRRPMLEVVLNSIDAKPHDFKGNYSINIKVKRKGFTSSDSGRGMSLEEILKFLIIPFNTEKKGVEEIGRFGVGFLSTFNYCLAEPGKVHLTVNTKNDVEGCIVDFYAKGHEISDLMMRVVHTGKSPAGTKVEIKRKVSKKSVVEYLKDHLKNVPSYISNIIVNKSWVNDDSNFKWYVQPVSLKVLGREVQQKVGFRASEAGWHSMTSLASQGVLVKQFNNECKSINATVSFPPAVQVVEGRDEFKVDDNYDVCVNATFKAFEEFLQDQEKNEEFTEYITNFVPSLVSALGVNNVSRIPNMGSICEMLFPGRKYVLLKGEAMDFKPFFKEFVENYAFETLSHQSLNYWESFYKNSKGMLEEILKPVQSFPLKDFISKIQDDKSFYPNLGLIAELLVQSTYGQACFVELPVGDNCFFINNNSFYINIRHPYVQGGLSHSKIYSLVSDYFALSEARKMHGMTKLDDIERGLYNTCGTSF